MTEELLSFLRKANPRGYFNYIDRGGGGAVMDGGDALMHGDLGSALARLNSKVIEVVFQKLKIEEIVGERVRAMDWGEDFLETPCLKFAGVPTQYSDFTNPNTLTMDTKIVRTRQVRDSLNIRVGDLENSQLTNAGINELERKTGGALNILLQRWNTIAFKGLEGVDDVYGLLNFPEISNYVSLSTDLGKPSYDTMLADIRALIKELQSQNNHIGDDSVMKLALSPAVSSLLQLDGNMQKSLRVYLQENYPQLQLVTNVNEFKGAYQGKSVMYLIGETPTDGTSEANTAYLPYSELALFGRIVEKESHTSQNISIGHSGVVILKPQNVVRGVIANGNG